MKTLDLQEASDNAMLALLAALLVEDAQKEAEKQEAGKPVLPNHEP